MSNQRNNNNNNTQVDNDDVQRSQEPHKYRPRNFYRRRPGNDRQNQDLGEDENRAYNNDDDTHRSNNFEENNNNNNQANDDDNANNTRGRRGRGGFRRGRGRGRFARDFNNYPPIYSPYTDYMNRRGGYAAPPGGFYGPAYYTGGDLPEQDGFNDYPVRGNRGFRRGRGRRGRITKNENTENDNNNNNNDQQEGENNTTNTTKRRQRQRTNDNASGTEQQTDGAATDDQQQEGVARQQGKKSKPRRRRNTNASQSGAETEERKKSSQTRKPADDETVVKNLLRSMVFKVARRLAPRNRRESRANTKEAGENNTDIEQSQPRNARRGGGGRRGGRPGNSYFIEQGYYDPYSMIPYYYGVYYGYSGRGFGGRGRRRGGRGRFRQRQGGANKENEPQDNSEGKKLEESISTGENTQTKPAITEQVNQSS